MELSADDMEFLLDCTILNHHLNSGYLVIQLNTLQKGVETMSDLTHLFKVGQKVTYRNNDFDAVKRNIPCIVKETYSDHIIITDTETNTDLWIEEDFNLDCVYPEYNMIGG